MTPYATIQPIVTPIPAARQSARRHYGVHPYFTRRPYNVVRNYILHYSREGDRVLDPFGGSGVTAIEAFLENRIGIHNDINPLANFIAKGIVDLRHGDISKYWLALTTLQDRCEKKLADIGATSERELSQWLKVVNLPPDLSLPSNSDVKCYHDLFMRHQLVALALLRDSIDSLDDRYARKGMLLAWSATLTKLNKTFLSAKGRLESRGGSSVFSIYRFKVAKQPISLPAWQTFYERAMNVIEAKEEIDKAIELKRRTGGWHGRFEVYEKDIEELGGELEGRVDYIFTDPPYGGHIAYLDLSILWNAWIGKMPSQRAREKELIVGGELNLDETTYVERLERSICACAKMLKTGRWMSVVFQHWNTAYFEAILRAAAESGMKLRAAISQVGDPIWSMHKKKGSELVLAGEMILTFFRNGKTQTMGKRRSFDVRRAVAEILDSTGSKHIYGEYLFNRVVMEAWQTGAIDALNITRTEFVSLIREHGWHYDGVNHYWVRDNTPGGLPFS
jgi:16S rRNA G966 N2-methylase RsmD